MPLPRSRIYDRTKPVTCHCISRCVRRNHLLAPEARRRALRDRLAQLAAIFAIDVLEWSLLSNHFHLVAATHPDLVALWSDEEVARRWRSLSPDYAWRRRNRIDPSLPAQEEEVAEAMRHPARLARWRLDLADLSAFHKFLKQKLARQINLQDDVTGHCFDGRFKSIVALDEEAVVAHMVYVALNPVRASLTHSLSGYEYSSIAERVEEVGRRIRKGELAGEVEAARRQIRSMLLTPALPCDPGAAAKESATLPNGRTNPWFGGRTPSLFAGSGSVGLVGFIGYVDAVGRVRRPGKPGVIDPSTPSPVAEFERLPSGPADSSRARELSTRLASVIEEVEAAMSRGLASPLGNFSGSAEALARVAKETGRRFIVAVAGLLPGRSRRVSAPRIVEVAIATPQGTSIPTE